MASNGRSWGGILKGLDFRVPGRVCPAARPSQRSAERHFPGAARKGLEWVRAESSLEALEDSWCLHRTLGLLHN